MTYGERLRAGRGDLPLRVVAVQLGISVQYLSEIERGRRAPLGPERDHEIARVLGFDPEPLEVLRVHALGVVSVAGLDVGGVERVCKMVARLRAKNGGSHG